MKIFRTLSIKSSNLFFVSNIVFIFIGILSQHILNNISSQINAPSYSSSGTNSNIPLESSNSIDPAIVSQRAISENDRSTIISNGSSDSHSLLDNTFSNNPFLSNTGDLPTTNGGAIGQLVGSIPINPEHHSLRYMLSSNILNQQTIPTGRVPLTQAELRMLNRLNSAYTKLPSLLESERQRYLFHYFF